GDRRRCPAPVADIAQDLVPDPAYRGGVQRTRRGPAHGRRPWGYRGDCPGRLPGTGPFARSREVPWLGRARRPCLVSSCGVRPHLTPGRAASPRPAQGPAVRPRRSPGRGLRPRLVPGRTPGRRLVLG